MALLTGEDFQFCSHYQVVVIILELIDASILAFQIKDLEAVISEVQSPTK